MDTASYTPVSEMVISAEVVAAIGAHAAAATPGVLRLEASLSGMLAGLGRSARHRIAGITPAPVTGTSVTLAAGQVSVRVEVAVSASRPAVETAAAVQRAVARAVTASTGLLVTGVSVAILDIGLPGGSRAPRWPGAEPPPADPGESGAPAGDTAADLAAGELSPVSSAGPPGSSRAQACAAVLAAVRSVPGLRPASPVPPERARWMHWDPAVLAVGLDGSHLEVQLAATALPLPARLEQAAAAIRQATAATPWGVLPHRLVVSALDAAALAGASAGGWG